MSRSKLWIYVSRTDHLVWRMGIDYNPTFLSIPCLSRSATYGLSLGPFPSLRYHFPPTCALFYHMYHHLTAFPFPSLPWPLITRTCILGLLASLIDSGGALKPSATVYKDSREDQEPHLGLLDNRLFATLLFEVNLPFDPSCLSWTWLVCAQHLLRLSDVWKSFGDSVWSLSSPKSGQRLTNVTIQEAAGTSEGAQDQTWKGFSGGSYRNNQWCYRHELDSVLLGWCSEQQAFRSALHWLAGLAKWICVPYRGARDCRMMTR